MGAAVENSENAADIRRALRVQLLEEGQVPVLSQLKEAERLARRQRVQPDYNHIGQRLEQARLELKDLAQECAAQLEHVRKNPRGWSRSAKGWMCCIPCSKHNVQTVEALMARMAFLKSSCKIRTRRFHVA